MTGISGQIQACEINGDEKLGAKDRLAYIFGNSRRNLKVGSHGMRVINWPLPEKLRNRDYLGLSSATRVLSEAFIRHALSDILPRKEISVLDIGCGSGRLSGLLVEAGYRGHYTGVDICNKFCAEHWSGGAFASSFIEGDIHGVEWTETYDLVISVSALEHIPNDAAMLSKMDKQLRPGGVQLHFVPAPVGLFLYLWHGYRQYGLQDLRDRFGTKNTRIYRLGGVASSLLHIGFVTIPEILLKFPLRKRFPSLYSGLLQFAMKLDAVLPVLPGFYAVCKKTPTETGQEVSGMKG